MTWDGRISTSPKDRPASPNPASTLSPDYCGQFALPHVEENGHPVRLNRHHIIPWSLLCRVWNRMIEDRRWTVLDAWLFVCGYDRTKVKPFSEDEPGGPVSQNPFDITGVLRSGGDLWEVEIANDMIGRICWPAWNIVIGPHEDLRSDPAGDGHDSFFDVGGLDAPRRAQMKTVDVLFGIMNQIDTCRPVPLEQWVALANGLLNVDRTARVTGFDRQMWQHTPHGDTRCAGRCWRKSTRKTVAGASR